MSLPLSLPSMQEVQERHPQAPHHVSPSWFIKSKACLGVHLVQFRQMNWSSEFTQIGSTGRVGQGLQWIWSIFRPDLELTRFIGGVAPSKCVPTYTTLFTFYIFLHKLYGPPFHTVVLLHSFCFYFDKPQILPYLFHCLIVFTFLVSIFHS